MWIYAPTIDVSKRPTAAEVLYSYAPRKAIARRTNPEYLESLSLELSARMIVDRRISFLPVPLGITEILLPTSTERFSLTRAGKLFYSCTPEPSTDDPNIMTSFYGITARAVKGERFKLLNKLELAVNVCDPVGQIHLAVVHFFINTDYFPVPRDRIVAPSA